MNVNNNWSTVFKVIKNVIESTDANSKKGELTNADFLNNFDPILDYSVETIFEFLPKHLNGPCIKLDFNYIKSYDHITPINMKRQLLFDSAANEFNNETAEKRVQSFDDIQKKIVPTLSEEVSSMTKTSKSDLIVITTLIDSPANLGGLTRTCEIYGVGQLVVNDVKITSNKEFKSLSLSSEKWVDLVEKKERDLIQYLLELKSSGYAIMGLEQTTNSKKLNSYCFPKRCALLLG